VVGFYYVARVPRSFSVRREIQSEIVIWIVIQTRDTSRSSESRESVREHTSVRLVFLGDRGPILKNANGGENVGAFATPPVTPAYADEWSDVSEIVCDGKFNFQGENLAASSRWTLARTRRLFE